jgi:glyoxylase-like metal-dependent hydrolase (beta-lactamase superfamily II)
MIVRILGCSGSIAAGNRTTSFLLDGDVLIDAGTGVGDLTLDEMVGVDHILLSHSHLDHVLGVPLLADSVMRRRLAAETFRPVQVYALPQTIDALKRHLLNDVLWPDFTRLPHAQRPIIELNVFEIGQQLTLGDKRIEILPAVHTVPAVGFAVDTPRGEWVFTGDTGPNPALWKRQLAEASRHLSPSLLAAELAQLDGTVNVFITHIKPGEAPAVMGQIAALGLRHEVRELRTGERFEV